MSAVSEMMGVALEKGSEKEKGVVFVDFGHGKICTLRNDDEILVFDSLSKLAEELKPSVIVLDNLPRTEQDIAVELRRKGITFLRLKHLKKLADERKNNGLRKSDENDVKLLRELFRRDHDAFQPLFSSPEELEVRELTELWVDVAGLRKSAKRLRTITNDPLAAEIHLVYQRYTERLGERIHEKAVDIPLYRKAFEELGLKGPVLAYIISHDGHNLAILPKDKLAIRYRMVPFRRSRPLRSHLLIMLANTTVLHKHLKYRIVYDQHRNKGKGHRSAVLRVALRILRDLHRLARKAGGFQA